MTLRKFKDGELPFVTPQMYGAKGDGETDDTLAIQRCLDENNFVVFPEGTYMIDPTNEMGAGQSILSYGGIKPRSNTTLILSEKAILKASCNRRGYYNIVTIVDVHDVKIIGGKIEGVRTSPEESTGYIGSEFGHGIYIRGNTSDDGLQTSEYYGSTNILIQDVEVYNCWGDSICTTGNYYYGDVYNIKIVNCNLHDSRRQGISVTRGKNVEISSCYIHDIYGTSPESCIDLEGSNDFAIKNIRIVDCVFENGNRISVSCSNESEDVFISNCVGEFAMLYNGKSSTISNCKFDEFAITTGVNLISNCKIGLLEIRAGNQNTIFNGCYFNGCDNSSNGGAAINSSDIYTDKNTHISFNDCVFDPPLTPSDSNDDASMFYRIATNVTSTVYKMEFNDCVFYMKNRRRFIGGPGTPSWLELVFDGCSLIFDGAFETIFPGITSLELNNSRIKSGDVGSFLITVLFSDRKLNYKIANNVFETSFNICVYNGDSTAGFGTPFSMIFNNNIFLTRTGYAPQTLASAVSASTSNVTLVGNNNSVGVKN